MTEFLNVHPENSALAIDQLPKTALQAIYHAVTGKTENYSKIIRGNVVINSSDIDQLYDVISQQLEHYTLLSQPTVTIVIKSSKNRTTQYSSWEKFKKLKVNFGDVTSEITIKVEFVATLPNTNVPQRCVVNILLDSALPVIDSQNEENNEEDPSEFLFFFGQKWTTVKVSIDFVDFLIARAFTSHVEEWFDGLEKLPNNKLNNFLIKNGQIVSAIFRSGSLAGLAIFYAAFAHFSDKPILFNEHIFYAISISISIFAAFQLVIQIVRKIIFSRISKNITPSVILLTEIDKTTYQGIVRKRNSANATAIGIVGTILLGMAINLASSYIYAGLN